MIFEKRKLYYCFHKIGSIQKKTFDKLLVDWTAILLSIKKNATRQLMVIPKQNFAECFQNWNGRCVRSHKEKYFEDK